MTQSWTLPYHGVTHLSGLKRPWQITVEDTMAYALCLQPPSAFTPVWQENHETREQAKIAGERFAVERNLFA